MFRRHLPIVLGLMAAVLLASGCSNKSSAAQTTVPIGWQNPEYADASFESFFVIGIAVTEERRRMFEDGMVKALEGKGAKAVASYTVFPDENKLQKDAVLAAVGERGVDGVLVTRLLHVDVSEEVVEGKTTYVPTSNADLYMMDYDQKYEEVREPDYIKKTKTYNVETTLYSAEDGDKVAYIVSETVDPETVEQIMGSVAETAAQSLVDANLLR